MRSFLFGRVMGVALVFGLVLLHSAYKLVDHGINFTVVDARIDSVKTVCTGKLKSGGEAEFPCDMYDSFRKDDRDVTQVATATLRYVSPVDNQVHSATLNGPIDGKAGGVLKVYASDSEPGLIEKF